MKKIIEKSTTSYFILAVCVLITACNTSDKNQNESLSQIEETTTIEEETTIGERDELTDKSNYELRRRELLENELPMISMEAYDISNAPSDIPADILKEYKNAEVCWYINYYNDSEIKIMLYLVDLYEPAIIWIQGEKYKFSYGDEYIPRTERPEICLYDINKDNIPDILIRGTAYRTMLRQDVYLSNADGGYTQLGDITWRHFPEKNDFQFTASLEDDYKVHVTAQEYGIDQVFSLGTSYAQVQKELSALGVGAYDSERKLTEDGKNWGCDELQGQAVRYILADDGSMILRYEAQIEGGYSTYCVGVCFVFEYEITEAGYQLLGVSVEEYDY